MKCFEYMLEGQDVIRVLPTGFGKSMLFSRPAPGQGKGPRNEVA